MARRQIKQSKGAADLYDSGRGHVLAEKIQPLPENLKKKISAVLEAIPTKSKSEIAEVLQACDYDVDKALNSFIADGGMETQNKWMVQGKRKNKKKKKSGKKASKDVNDTQSQDGTEGTPTGEAEQKNIAENLANGTEPKEQPTDKPTTTTKDTPKPLENLKPVVNDETKPEEASPLVTSPPPLSPLLSPTDSVNSSQDSHTLTKSRAGSSANERHPRVRTISGSGNEVIKRSLKDLQRSSVSIARYQSMLDEQADTSTKTVAKSFQAIRQALDEREKVLAERLESVIVEAKKLLEDRQENAAGLKFKCNRVSSMSDEETNELRNEIKHFVGERRIDEDLGKTMRFIRDQEKMLETVNSFGEVPPIKNHYTPFKRKHPEPAKSNPHKPAPVKTTTTNKVSTPSTTVTSTKPDSSSETRGGNSRNDKRPLLSPARLKDQAEIHARLQQAVKEQQVSPVSKEGSNQSDRNAAEKPKPKDFGAKFSRNNNVRGQQGNSRREQTQQRQRQTNFANPTQNSPKSFGNRNENKTNGESSKTQPQGGGTKAQDKPAESVPQAQGGSPADNGTPAQKDKPAEGEASAEEKPATAHGTNGHMNHNQGNRSSKRRYVRKTPPDDGTPVFRTGTLDTANNTSSAKESGDGNEDDWSNGQVESQDALPNGTNGFVPLPQRNRRPRKFYCKKDPGSKIEFPPARENGSVPA